MESVYLGGRARGGIIRGRNHVLAIEGEIVRSPGVEKTVCYDQDSISFVQKSSPLSYFYVPI